MLKLIVRTKIDNVATIARIILGFLFFVHGSQQMLGWFGGYGFNGSMQFFAQQAGVPAPLAFLAITSQFFGGIMLLLGLVGRLAALAIISDMVVAIIKVHWHFGLFMNWYGTQKGEGFEYHLLTITVGLVVLVRGSGSFSLDRLLLRASEHSPAELNHGKQALNLQ